MNKYQNALDGLKEQIENATGMHIEDNEEFYNWIQTMQELVDKETPLKPRVTTTDRIDFNCNCCGAFIGRIQNWNQLPSIENKKEYCSKCGNKIDWSKEK